MAITIDYSRTAWVLCWKCPNGNWTALGGWPTREEAKTHAFFAMVTTSSEIEFQCMSLVTWIALKSAQKS